MKEIKYEAWRYEFDAWMSILESVPKFILYSIDKSESYEMDRRHLFKLENGRYAVVKESGCSCYSPSGAVINLFEELEQAKLCFQGSPTDYDYPKWRINAIEELK